MTSVFYFAFGANMSSAVLRRRRIEVVSRERARLDRYRLVFDMVGVPWVEPAFASIEPDPERAVYGVLYHLTPSQLDRVGSYEGRGYSVIEVDVEGERSGTTRSRTYQTRRPVTGLCPSRRYLNVLCEGARENELPPSYIRELCRHPSVYVPVLSEMAGKGIDMFEGAYRFLNRIRAR